MKFLGQEVSGPNTETIVIPRGNGKPIVFTAQAILDYDEFDALCKRPEPPVILQRGGRRSANFQDGTFTAQLSEYGRRKHAWMVLTSLRFGTPELTWDTVDYEDVSTWENYEKELKDSGFSQIEIQRIVNGVMIANCLDDDMLEAARKSFFASLEELEDQSYSPTEGLQITPSGDRAND